MVYHEVRKKNGEFYNYIVRNIRKGGKWDKKSKFIGKGRLIKDEIKKKIELFKSESYKSLSKEDYFLIEDIKNQFKEYLKKGGKSGKKRFEEWYFTELTYNSNAIEGNSLSLRDTSMILNENIIPKNSTLREVYEVKNHKQAITFLENYKGDLNEDFLLKLHSFILKEIDDENAGVYRKIPVFIYGSNVKLPSYNEVPKLMKAFFKGYKKIKREYHPIELAALISMKFVTIHPFIDGNGRVSRLLMNFIMKKFGYPEINIYMKHRNNYMMAVRKANDKDYELIIDFLIKTIKINYKFLEELKKKS